MKQILIHGVGINDADYKVTEGYAPAPNQWKITWRCPIYTRWRSMLSRCYGNCKSHGHAYKDCTVCDEWLTFSNFKRWFDNLNVDLSINELDKDLLVEGNRVYSPETCVFISKYLNNYIKDRDSTNGLLGVSLDKRRNKYRARCRNPFGESEWLGYYDNEFDAHSAWRKRKMKVLIYLQSQQTCERTKQGLQRIIDKLQHHIDNNIETKDL